MPEHISGLLIHATGTPHWSLRPVKVWTSSELYSNCFRWLTFLDCLGIQFFNSPISQHSQLGYLWFPTPHCATPVLLPVRYTMSVVT